ncbi:zinc-ribbon domain-containing protein [Klebsiella pneumoniae]|uniref:putative zinc ribbon protein n=1 Tax=Enterobacteriaceae TaxID=543 RepID=UPI000D743303|nr:MULTISPECIES: putative zinc ribbon protein [Klebsiella]EFL7399548.1 hypothetical protein [Escherichia coli]HDS7782073.1 hypothetical protein [Klebsiella pneumoniae subsp. ozaenae]HDT3172301.1 hypothetical protein [Klebsiella pneumoniae subsp. pneumoniae]ELA0894721.1 hypothetical protein [Klebsiella pneumoniae]MBE8770023.1 hypothetical protein [Klebsiella quasipneumoniae]
MHKSTLQNLKLYLALDSDGHYVISKEMKNTSDAQWFCPSCSCPVKLHNDTSGENAWFVHNPDEATKPLLANCGYLNTEIKRRVFILRLRTMIDELETLTATRCWFCVWCKAHYEGEKHCKACNTGIYSISHGDWCWNYNHKENTPEISDHTAININHHHQTACIPS